MPDKHQKSQGLTWFARKDSNLDFQGQNLTCCHCTTGEQIRPRECSTASEGVQIPPDGGYQPPPINGNSPKDRTPPLKTMAIGQEKDKKSTRSQIPGQRFAQAHQKCYSPLLRYVAPSSSGLGRWPLTPETWVRVPLGSPVVA